MINLKHRFHGYGSLRGVYQRGKSLRGGQLGLKYSSRGPAKPWRAAVVVSRKVNKSAVVRNRIRRRIYEAIRLADKDIAPGTDLVFTVYSDQLATIESDKLSALTTDLIKKAV